MIAFLFLCIISSSWAKPPPLLNYQDSIGQYSFGYNHAGSSRSEYRSSDGLTRGTYSYVDQDGRVQTAEYEAGGDLGFQVRVKNVPQPATPPARDTPEVSAATREQHTAKLLEEVSKKEEETFLANQRDVQQVESTVQPEIKVDAPSQDNSQTIQKADVASRANVKPNHFGPSFHIPINVHESVTYTPEVLAAREAHFRAYERAQKLAIESDENPHILEKILWNHGVQESPTTELPTIEDVQKQGIMPEVSQGLENLPQDYKESQQTGWPTQESSGIQIEDVMPENIREGPAPSAYPISKIPPVNAQNKNLEFNTRPLEIADVDQSGASYRELSLVCGTDLKINGLTPSKSHHHVIGPTFVATYPSSSFPAVAAASYPSASVSFTGTSSTTNSQATTTSTTGATQVQVPVPVIIPVYHHPDLGSLFLQTLFFGLQNIQG